MSATPHIGFVDGACRSTRNLSSTTWAIYDPNNELIDLQGIYLGRTTNNFVEGHQTVVRSHRSGNQRTSCQPGFIACRPSTQWKIFHHKPSDIGNVSHIHLLERNFDYITYHHIPRHMNTLTDALANCMLDRHLRNM